MALSLQASICTTFGSRRTDLCHLCFLSFYSQSSLLHTAQRLQFSLIPNSSRLNSIGANYVHRRKYQIRASGAEGKDSTQIVNPNSEKNGAVPKNAEDSGIENGAPTEEEYPSGVLQYKVKDGWDMFVMRLKLLITVPWQRVKKGSVLKLKLSGKASLNSYCNVE